MLDGERNLEAEAAAACLTGYSYPRAWCQTAIAG